jgi:hypothetical protein
MSLLETYGGVPGDDEYYREQWRAYYAERSRRIGRLALLLGVTGFLALLFGLVPESFQEQHVSFTNFIAALGGLLWLVIVVQWFMLNWEMGTWSCPRCGENFFASTFVRNPFGTRCRHCKLRRLRKSEITTPSLT